MRSDDDDSDDEGLMSLVRPRPRRPCCQGRDVMSERSLSMVIVMTSVLKSRGSSSSLLLSSSVSMVMISVSSSLSRSWSMSTAGPEPGLKSSLIFTCFVLSDSRNPGIFSSRSTFSALQRKHYLIL